MEPRRTILEVEGRGGRELALYTTNRVYLSTVLDEYVEIFRRSFVSNVVSLYLY